jgi:hypothetical protein
MTVKTVASFINRLLRDHHEGEAGKTSGLAAQ